jgi:hypothetical protein
MNMLERAGRRLSAIWCAMLAILLVSQPALAQTRLVTPNAAITGLPGAYPFNGKEWLNFRQSGYGVEGEGVTAPLTTVYGQVVTTAPAARVQRILRAAARPISSIAAALPTANITTTSGSAGVTINSGSLVNGQAVFGTGIPIGTTVSNVTITSAALSQSATASGATTVTSVGITAGGTGVASTINGTAVGSPTYPANGKAFAPINGTAVQGFTNGGPFFYIQGPARTGGVRVPGHGAGWAVATRSPQIDFGISNGTNPVTFLVTDLATGVETRVQATDIVTTGNPGYVKLDFGVAAPRIIKVFANQGNNFNLSGVNVATGYDVWAPLLADPVRTVLFGDSWLGGTLSGGANDAHLTVPDYLAARKGVSVPYNFSRAGTGALATNNGADLNWLQQIQAGTIDVARIGQVDEVDFAGSVNDANATAMGGTAATDAQVQAQTTLIVQAARTAQPGAVIVFLGPEYTTSYPTPQSRFDAYRNGCLAAAATDANVVCSDMSPTGSNILNAANVSTMIGADGVHVNDVGKQYVGDRWGQQIITDILAKYGPISAVTPRDLPRAPTNDNADRIAA